MPKKKHYDVDQKLSDIIHDLFQGDPKNLDKKRLIKIYNDKKINVNFQRIDESNLKDLSKIYKLYTRDIRIIVKPRSKKVYKLDEGISDIEGDNKSSTIDSLLELKKEPNIKVNRKYVDIQRKAYINWINNEFITIDDQSKLTIYQSFIKTYLSEETPYRGLLVYHGLGTGKTATAISTAEGLSNSMDITTLLPASLETEFIKEVQEWGDKFFKVKDSQWIFVPINEILNNQKLLDFLNKHYKITPVIITDIYRSFLRKRKGEDIDKGLWLNPDIFENNQKVIKKYEDLSPNEQLYINEQIKVLLPMKYNFIHYNPFPTVFKSKKYMNEQEFLYGKKKEYKKDKESKTYNQKLMDRLYDKLLTNIEKYNINSPFYKEVIIIDEVHNFVREIVNNSDDAILFYNWILNAKDIKLICLSGTPIINKPSEISILYNMIRGVMNVYNFRVKPSMSLSDIDSKLRDIIYEKQSPIYQYNISKVEGYLLISFLKQQSNYSSLLNKDNNIIYTYNSNEYSLDEFFESIYSALYSIIDTDSIVPSKKELDSISSKDKVRLLRGDQWILLDDKIVNKKEHLKSISDNEYKLPIFNEQRTLFSINKNNHNVDLTDNNTFIDYFFNNDSIPTNKQILLKRMLQGLTSYYPINRSAVKIMPTIIPPNNELYNDYSITKNIQVELCPMSSIQFKKYESYWKEDRLKSSKYSKKNMYDDSSFNTSIRTRQSCNMVYDNEQFRTLNKDKDNEKYISEKQKEYKAL